MNIGMFIIGGIIFSIYMYFTLWNIFYSSKKQRKENYPGYRYRPSSMGGSSPDNMDYDGMGNFSRTPSTEHKLPSGTKSRRGVERTVRVKNKKVHGKIQ
jgi:hypothetical protein|tara:strand:- start:28 stop:324 length:297 start_codon:yes stop_codon:yes gene_type:complete